MKKTVKREQDRDRNLFWRCRQCGCELTLREQDQGRLIPALGGFVSTVGLCYVCAGDRREEMFGTRERMS